jgi:hypothetical protein
MYADLLPALARARQEEFLLQREFRDNARHATARRVGPAGQPFPRTRQRVGAALVAAGARLMDSQGGGVELLHK